MFQAEALDFLGGVDILVMPGAKVMQGALEKIEPELLVTYGETASEIALALGTTGEVVAKCRDFKDAHSSYGKDCHV